MYFYFGVLVEKKLLIKINLKQCLEVFMIKKVILLVISCYIIIFKILNLHLIFYHYFLKICLDLMCVTNFFDISELNLILKNYYYNYYYLIQIMVLFFSLYLKMLLYVILLIQFFNKVNLNISIFKILL